MILTSTKTSASYSFYHLPTHKYLNNTFSTHLNPPIHIHNRNYNINRNNVGLAKGTQMSIHRLKAVDSGENQNETAEEVLSSKLKDTMADLDAILGIEEDAENKDIELSKKETTDVCIQFQLKITYLNFNLEIKNKDPSRSRRIC